MITRDDIAAASGRLAGHILRTPLRRSEWLSSATGGEISIKLESLQPTFSFKIRGALHAILRLAERGAQAEVVTASAGNHGRGMAYAAAMCNVRLTVYVPEKAPRVKLEALHRSGAVIVTCRDYDAAEAQAKEHGAGGSAIYISPYSHPDVIAGAGTIGLEILEDSPDLDIVVVALGGGGLASGVGIAVHDRAETYAVEAEASCPFTRGIAAGHIVEIEVGATLADGLAGNLDPDTMTFDLVRRYSAGIVTVSEDAIEDAVRGLVGEERLIGEGAAATAIAGVLGGGIPLRGKRAAVVLSGANIDPELLGRIVARGQRSQ